jgi:hypothetical protein
LFIFEQPLKAYIPIDIVSTTSGISRFSSEPLPLKALSPIYLKLEGRLRVPRAEKPANALDSILCTPSLIVSFANLDLLVLFLNAD